MENKYSEEDIKLLKRHVSNIDSNIYVIYNLPPEVIAVLFAYVSRSPASFRDNLLKLLKGKELNIGDLISSFESIGMDYSNATEKAREFHEKWVVGYGHSSVAEHACASVAIEDVSIIATKIIEDIRLASYTEKSTRYQQFDKTRYYKPKALMESEYSGLYVKTMDMLFDAYTEMIPVIVEFMKNKFPQEDGQSDFFYKAITNARAFDIIRYMLPASTFSNLGMTANARVYEFGIVKMLSHDLEEIRDIGQKIKNEVKKIIPTLVKFADARPFFPETNKQMEKITREKISGLVADNKSSVVLVDYDRDTVNKLVATMMYRYCNLPYCQVKEKVNSMDDDEKGEIIDNFMSNMGRHDWPLRELEHVYYTFDILIDFGAFRDIQRHRMATQTNQLVTADHGFDIPEGLEEVDDGLKERFVECMEKAKEAYDVIVKDFPKEAQYVVPMAFRKRVLFTWNLRELHHFIKLRSGKEGHISYRRIAKECYDRLMEVHPVLAKYIRIADNIDGPARG